MKQLRELTPFILKTAIVSALLVFVAALAATGVNLSDMKHLSLASVTLIAGAAAVWAIDTLGRFTWFRKLQGIPNLSGRWEGWHFPNGARQWHEMACELRQVGSRVTHGKAFVRGRVMERFATAIVTNPDTSDAHWVWSYVSCENRGTYFLRLREGGTVLEGTTVETLDKEDKDSTQQAVIGRVLTKKSARPLIDDLRYDEDGWAMSTDERAQRTGR